MSYTSDLSFSRERTSSGKLLLVMTVLFFGSIIALTTQAQTVENASFGSGKAGWGEKAMVLPFSAFENDELDAVAVVDGGAVTHQLRQRIGGLVPGTTYELAFDAMRWSPDGDPQEITASVLMDGEVHSTITRRGEGGMQQERIHFTAAAETMDLRIEPERTGRGAMLIDDVSITAMDRLPGVIAARDRNVELGQDDDLDHVKLVCCKGDGGLLRVLDHTGRVVRVVHAREGEATLIDIAALPNGRYHVQSARNGAVLGRFVKL